MRPSSGKSDAPRLVARVVAGATGVGRGPQSLALRNTLEAYTRTLTETSGAHTMPKELKNKREEKKKPTMSPKEKKAAKQLKKAAKR